MAGRYYPPEGQREERYYLHKVAFFCDLFFYLAYLGQGLGDFGIVRIIEEKPGFPRGLSTGEILRQQIFGNVCVPEWKEQEQIGNIRKQKGWKQRSQA